MSRKTGTYRACKGPARPLCSGDPWFAEMRFLKRMTDRATEDLIAEALEPRVEKVVQGDLVGVATAGRPVARVFDDGLTLEVNRTRTNGAPNANSMLYGAVWRAAKAMGYRRCITYTQADETGASLRAVGWRRVGERLPRKSWAESSVKLREIRDPVGSGGVARVLWEICR